MRLTASATKSPSNADAAIRIQKPARFSVAAETTMGGVETGGTDADSVALVLAPVKPALSVPPTGALTAGGTADGIVAMTAGATTPLAGATATGFATTRFRFAPRMIVASTTPSPSHE